MRAGGRGTAAEQLANRSVAVEQSRLRGWFVRARVPEVSEVRRPLELEVAGLYESLATSLRQAVAEILELPGRRETCHKRPARAIEAFERRDAGTAKTIRAEYLEKAAALLREVFTPTDEAEAKRE